MTSQEQKTQCKVCDIEKPRPDFPGPRGKTCSACRKLLARASHIKYNSKRPPETPERKAAKAAWFSERKDLWDATLRRRRALKNNCEGQHTEQEWIELLEKYNQTCLSCHLKDLPLTRDHIKPLSMGGSDWISNIQPLCRSCNSKKHTKEIDYRTDFAL